MKSEDSMIKRKSMLIAAVFASASLLFVSCGSTPAAEPAPVETEQDATVSEESTEVDNLEEKIEDDNLDDENTKGNEDDPELENRINSLWENIESARNAAIQSGAKNLVPEIFGMAEEEYDRLKNGDASIEELEALNRRYAALKALADAKSKKDRIDEMNLASYRQAEYDKGSALIDELSAENAKDTISQADWESKAIEADNAMTAVLEAGLKARAGEERALALKAQRNANSIKCYVSRKAEYDSLVKAFKEGDVDYVTKNPEGALAKYIKAKEGFESLFNEVSEARSKAQMAIDDAKKRVEASENVAVQADIEKPLGDEPVEGIEEADAKLLEDDDYSKAESAEVELNEEVPEDLADVEEEDSESAENEEEETEQEAE